MWKDYLNERETKRLLIRPLVKSDSQEWQEFIMDGIATKYFPDDWKLQPEKSVEWIELQLARYKENRYGLLALVDKSTGKLIGQCGLLSQKVDGKDELEIGYHLIPKYWGNGYAIEAASEFKNISFENNLAESIISIIDTNNSRSQKVAQRNGMTLETQTIFLGMDVFIFRIKMDDYLKIASGNL